MGCPYGFPMGCPYGVPMGCPYGVPMGCPYVSLGSPLFMRDKALISCIALISVFLPIDTAILHSSC